MNVGLAGAGSAGQVGVEAGWKGGVQHVYEGLVAHEAQRHQGAGGLVGGHGVGAAHPNGIAVEGGAGAVNEALAVRKGVFVVHPSHHGLAFEQGAGAGAQVAQLAVEGAAHAQHAVSQPRL